MHKHILVPVDLANTAMSDRAIAVARDFARREGARISMISVVPVELGDDTSRAQSDHEARLAAFIGSVSDGLDIKGEVKLGGSISGRIIEAVVKNGVDLVIMASHDPRISDYLIGSNAAHVVLHSPRSVLVVRQEGAARLRRILVPVDLDRPKSALKALDTARDLAKIGGGSVEVVSVQPILTSMTGKTPPDYTPKMEAFLKEHGAGLEGHLRRGGSIPAEIRWMADEIDADLIVMASHDPNITDYLVGSNAAHVALHSTRSVMVVR